MTLIDLFLILMDRFFPKWRLVYDTHGFKVRTKNGKVAVKITATFWTNRRDSHPFRRNFREFRKLWRAFLPSVVEFFAMSSESAEAMADAPGTYLGIQNRLSGFTFPGFTVAEVSVNLRPERPTDWAAMGKAAEVVVKALPDILEWTARVVNGFRAIRNPQIMAPRRSAIAERLAAKMEDKADALRLGREIEIELAPLYEDPEHGQDLKESIDGDVRDAIKDPDLVLREDKWD
jgi:hypothetical protein